MEQLFAYLILGVLALMGLSMALIFIAAVMVLIAALALYWKR